MNDLDYIQSVNSINEIGAIGDGFNHVFWVLMLINVICIAIVQTTQPGYIRTMFITCIYNRLLYQNIQNDLKIKGIGALCLVLAYMNCIGILLLEISELGYSSLSYFVPVGLLLLILIKFAFIKGVSFLSARNEGTSEHIYNHLLFFQAGAIILTPILLGNYFLSDEIQRITLIILLTITGLLILFREIHSFIRALRVKISPFYIILYLCTLELLPLIVLLHVLVSKNAVLN